MAPRTSGHLPIFCTLKALPHTTIPIPKVIPRSIGIITNSFHSFRKAVIVLGIMSKWRDSHMNVRPRVAHFIILGPTTHFDCQSCTHKRRWSTLKWLHVGCVVREPCTAFGSWSCLIQWCHQISLSISYHPPIQNIMPLPKGSWYTLGSLVVILSVSYKAEPHSISATRTFLKCFHLKRSSPSDDLGT